MNRHMQMTIGIKYLVDLPGDNIHDRNAIVYINDTETERKKKLDLYRLVYKEEPQRIFTT